MKASNSNEDGSNTTSLSESHTLTALRKIGDIIHCAADLDEMLHRSLQEITSIFSADRAWILRPVSPEDELFTIKSELNHSKWPEASAREITLKLKPATKEVIQRCCESKTARTFNFVNDEFINQPALFKRFSIQTQLCITLTPEHGQPWILGLQYCTEGCELSELDLQLFTEITRQIESSINTFQVRLELQQSKKRLEKIIKHAPEASLIIDAARGIIIEANENAADLFKKPLQELLTCTLISLSPEKQPDGTRSDLRLNEFIINAIDGETPSFEWSFSTAEGKIISCTINLMRLPSQKEIIIHGSISDITQQKYTALQMHKLSTALEQATDAVMVTDANGTIEYINRSFEKITGYNQQDAIGKTPNILRSGNQTAGFYKSLWKTIRAGEPFSNVFLNRKKDNSLYYEEKKITPLHNSQGEITHYISTARDISSHMKIQEHLEFLANHDVLTQLPNRTELTNLLSQEIFTAANNEAPLAVLFLDLDKFKAINDTLGHDVGDISLQQVSKLLINNLKKDNIIARFGGDEFVVVLNDIDNANEAGQIAQHILDTFTTPFMIDGHEVFMSASIGITIYPHDGDDSKALLKNAGIAAYYAKDRGRNAFNFFNTRMSDVADSRHEMELKLRHALENDEFHLLYQPLVEMESGRPVGVEALIRWQPEGSHPISPLEFIPILEETGLIVSVGEWVLETACKQLSRWKKMGAKEFRMSINISSRQFHDDELEAMLLNNIAKYNINPPDLDLEITESLLLEQSENTISMINRISKIGFHLSIDDFGTGYSSLSYLKRLPLNTLKIDRTFVHDIQTEDDSTTLVKAIVAMANSLRMNIIVEGVETEQQLEILQEMGCKVAQGYYFSKPVVAEELSNLLIEHQIIE